MSNATIWAFKVASESKLGNSVSSELNFYQGKILLEKR